jgi:hypothetical protein
MNPTLLLQIMTVLLLVFFVAFVSVELYRMRKRDKEGGQG